MDMEVIRIMSHDSCDMMEMMEMMEMMDAAHAPGLARRRSMNSNKQANKQPALARAQPATHAANSQHAPARGGPQRLARPQVQVHEFLDRAVHARRLCVPHARLQEQHRARVDLRDERCACV